ncbi:MAG: glycosyltransferase family 2 protein [Planctomycetota bacterium]|nr:glycosyltransferase family 2 protein [Planctomycetota bacterium]MDA1178658.1 glycosyltransferase family 2 protein [Planctomycetota bacterium]
MASDNGYDVSVVVPTYCEAENLPTLIPRISNAMSSAGLHGEILVVDDNSPDDTTQVCDQLSSDSPVRLIVRTKERGLSSAVIEGMKQAQGAALIVIDADLSHPPEKIPELIRALQVEGTDFVIGSRYVPGGGTDEEWGLFRWFNSKVATWLAYPLTSARDPMAGFFALRRDHFLQALPQLDPIGYKIGLELIVKCECKQIAEVPIFFGNRLRGESKLSIKEQLNYLRHLKRLYEHKWRNLAQFIQFLFVGASGTIVDLLAFTSLIHWVPTNVGRGIAIGVAMTWNYWFNRQITFSGARQRSIPHQYLLYCLSCAAGAMISWSVFVGLHSQINYFHEHPVFAALVGIVLATLSNFLLSKHLAFR